MVKPVQLYDFFLISSDAASLEKLITTCSDALKSLYADYLYSGCANDPLYNTLYS